MLVLDASDVRRHLTPQVAYAAVEAAFRALRGDTTQQPVRTQLATSEGVTLVKPAVVDGCTGVKVASLSRGNGTRGLDLIQGFVVLLDPATGVLDALLDGAAVTELRTAATSALATTLLARPDAALLGILGAGVQARSHLQAMHASRRLEQALVWAPSGLDELLRWAGDRGLPLQAATDAEQVVRESDILCTVTTSPVPVLQGDWLAPGTHLNAVGAFRPHERELDTVTMQRARVVVDMQEAAAEEAGAVLLARAEGAEVNVVADLAEVLSGRASGRTCVDEITVFSSTGLAVQDVMAARAAVTAARAAGAGVQVAFP
jgi:alanine dehydrogenase